MTDPSSRTLWASRLAQASRSVLRVAWRWTRRLLITVATIVGLILTALAVAQWTPAGRDAVLRVGLSQVNAIVPGTINAQSLGRLSLLGIELKGVVVLDPAGTQVLSLDEISIQTHLSRLLRGNIALRLVRVRGLHVDARILEERRGLLAAFVDPDAPASPPSSSPPPDVLIERVDLKEIHARLAPLDPLGQLDAHVTELTGAFRLIGGLPSARIDRAKLSLSRGAETVLELRAQGRVQDEEDPSHLQLHLDSLGMSVDLTADTFLPHQEGWQERPLSVQAGVQGVTAERLAKLLNDPTLKAAFLGPVGLSVQLDGTINEPQAKGALTTAAGMIEIADLSVKPTEWKVALSTRDFQLDQLRADLPHHRVTAELALSAEGTIPEPLKFELSLRSAQLDSVELMDLDLTGHLRDKRVEDLQLALTQGDSRINAHGNVALNGEAEIKVQIDLRPTLIQRLARLAQVPIQGRLHGYAQVERKSAGELTLGGRLNIEEAKGDEWQVRAVETRFSLQGKPEDLTGSVNLQLSDAAAGGVYLDELKLDLKGGAQQLGIELQVQVASTPRPADGERPAQQKSDAELSLKVQRREASTWVQGDGSGRLLGRPWEIDLEETEIFDKGALSTEGITLSAGGQQLVVSGSFGSPKNAGNTTSELRLQGESLDVARLAELAGLTEPLVGKIDLNAVLRGTALVPEVKVDMTGRGLGLSKKPLVDLTLSSRLDTKEGIVHLESQVTGNDIAVSLQGDAVFEGGPGALERLAEAEGEVQLKLGKLTTQFLEPYLPPNSMPVAAQLEGEISASGSRADPRLQSSLSFSTTDAGANARLLHLLKYEEGGLSTSLEIRDAIGLWAQAKGELRLSAQTLTLEQIAAAIPRAAQEGALRLDLKTNKRDLSKLPLVGLIVDPADLPPIAVNTELALTQDPGEEPDLIVRLIATQSKDLHLGGCKSARGAVEVEATHQGKDNQITLRALIGKREALKLHLSAEQAFAPLLAGTKPAPGPVSMELSSARLELKDLPFVCGKAAGRVSLAGQGSDLIGKNPLLQIRGEVERLSLGGSDGIDGELNVRADDKGLEAKAEVRARERFVGMGASLQAEIPWRLSMGKLELQDELPIEAQLRLQHLPIAPLLPPKGAISYARGSLDGEVRVAGTLSAPNFRGEIRLEDLGFTSTAIAQPLRDISGSLGFFGRKVKIQKLEAHDLDGELRVDGSIDLTDLERVVGEMQVVAKDFPIRQAGQVVAITNMKARAKATVTPDSTEAHLHLSDVDTWLENGEIRSGISLEGHRDFEVDGRSIIVKVKNKKSPSKTEAAGVRAMGEPPATESRTHIVLESADRFWVKRDDFAVKLNLLLDTEVVGDAVRIIGEVEIDRGYLLLFGKPFDLKRESRLRFIGSNPPDPVLEIEASHKTREGTAVSVRITGRGSAPVVTFIVDEVEVDASIAVQALFGSKQSGEDDEDPSLQAQSFVSALSAGVLASAARRELGAAAPILMIDPDDTAGEGRLRAGFELDQIVPDFLQPLITGVYLEGIVAREAQGEAAAQTNFGALLELYHPKSLFTAGQYGPGTTWSIDFGWQPF